MNELGDPFFSLKRNDVWRNQLNVIKKCFSELCEPLRHVFNWSTDTGVFWGKFKIPCVLPVYKVGDSSDLTNCRPTSVLPCFSKILGRIMHSCLFSYVTQEKIPYPKKLDF